jgi:hypothetical protein
VAHLRRSLERVDLGRWPRPLRPRHRPFQFGRRHGRRGEDAAWRLRACQRMYELRGCRSGRGTSRSALPRLGGSPPGPGSGQVYPVMLKPTSSTPATPRAPHRAPWSAHRPAHAAPARVRTDTPNRPRPGHAFPAPETAASSIPPIVVSPTLLRCAASVVVTIPASTDNTMRI